MHADFADADLEDTGPQETCAHLAEVILSCVHREFPNSISLLLASAADLRAPRQLYPAFFGSFDWHSAVHGHWSLARATRVLPEGDLRDRCLGALRTSLTEERLAGEVAHLTDRPGFECPYGVAWLLLLAAELDAIGSATAAENRAIARLADVCERNFLRYLDRLTHPVRSGQHDQSAFALGLFLDAARSRGRGACARAIEETALRLHRDDRDAPLHFEPSNHDFLSPAFASADLMRRVLPPDEFTAWFGRLLPAIPTVTDESWVSPIDCPDPSDGRLSHRIGLNLSRAWMLEAVAEALPEGDPRIPTLARTAAEHRHAGLAAIDPRHYSGAHWLGTFGIYLVSGRSEGPPPAEPA